MTPPATLLFTGDALFPGGVGKTDSPAQFGELSQTFLKSSLETLMMKRLCFRVTGVPQH